MATVYFVVMKTGESEASDFAIGSKPTEKSEVKAAVAFASVAKIEAENVTEAQQAARAAYPGRANVIPVVVTEAQWKES